MTHLRIEQNNGITEQVSPSVIEKLYEIVHSGNLDSSSNLMGSLNTTSTYLNYVDYLEELFTKNGVRLLIISANKLYIYFADPEVNRVLANRWGDGNGVTLIDMASVTALPNSLFESNKTITSFNELNKFINITSINAYVFKLCSALTSIDLSNITSIGNLAFKSCSLLTSVGDTSNVTLIDSYTFLACSSLTSIDLSNVTTIGNEAFRNCSALTSVGDLSNVTSIGSNAFNGCSSLTSIDLSNVTTIDSSTFCNCNKLTTLDLSSVTSIGDHAFAGCTSLTQFPCDPSVVTQIWDSAFENCTNMGLDKTLELNLTLLTKCPQYAFKSTKFKGLILHWPSLSNLTFDGRYNIWEEMLLLEYLDMSDTVAPIFDSTNLYRGFGFYQNPNITTAIFPATMNYLSDSMFTLSASVNDNTKYKYLILLSTTPPYLNLGSSNYPRSDFFRGRPALNIYVPDSALSSYLSDSDWLQLGDGTNNFNLSDRVKGLSQLPAGVWTTGLASLYLTPAQLVTS